MQRLKTLLADPNRIFLQGLKTVLQQDPNYDHHIAAWTQSGKQLIQLWRHHHPDLLMMELDLVEINGIEAITSLRQLVGDELKIIVVSTHRHPDICNLALQRGANGYLHKYAAEAELYKAIQTVISGQVYLPKSPILPTQVFATLRSKRGTVLPESFVQQHRLTKRETQILKLISQAMNNKEIGRVLYISDQTVSVHRKNIMRKLGVSSTAGLIKMAYEHSVL